MKIINNIGSISFLIALAILSEPAMAQFQDQGLITAVVRTDYNSQTEGTSSNHLTFVNPCIFLTAPCGNSPTVFSATNSFFQNTSSYPSSNYWVLDFNNEPAFNYTGGASTSNPGPPNQSIARSAPGFGLMGFTTLKDTGAGENFYRAHLVLNGTFPNPMSTGLPFIAIGSERDRGNNGVAPGTLNYTPGYKRVQFTAKLWDLQMPTQVGTQPPTLAFYVYAKSYWGGKARGVFVTLYHWNIDNSSTSQFTKYLMNWPIQESFYHPGVEWTFIDAEDVQPLCGFSIPRLTTKGQQISYDINLQLLFQCISNLGGWDTPMPTSGTPPITGVHWANEMSGNNGSLWTSVHNMKMVQ